MALCAVSLFSGVGGLDAALEYHGIHVAAQVENDPYCQAVLDRRWLDVPRYGDIKEINWHDFTRRHGPVDLVAGGFPCQPTSQAGRRKAQEDPRWLWPEVARCVRVLRPRYVFLENTLGLLSRGFDDVLGDLAALGLDAVWDCFQAADVGAPHERDRIFLLAYAKRGQLQRRGEPEVLGGTATAEPSQGHQRQRAGNAARDRSEAVADPLCSGLQGATAAGVCSSTSWPAAARDGGRLLESRVGRGPTGPPGWLDGYRWPAPPGPDQYPWEPPRTVGRGKIPNRALRVKVLGNLVVPQQGALALAVLWRRMEAELAAAGAEA